MSDEQARRERHNVEGSEVNWSGVFFGGALLVLLVAVVEPVVFRVLAAIVALAVTIYIAQSREEPEVESPLLKQIREARPGLDRRKYGRLRQATNDLLSHIRQLNRIAVDARSGKVTHRHANAELDLIASKMKGVIDQARKAAGIPTPLEEPGRGRGHPGAPDSPNPPAGPLPTDPPPAGWSP